MHGMSVIKQSLPNFRLREWVWLSPLVVGVVLLVAPVLYDIAEVSWSTEQGAHGPIVLGIGLWLMVRQWPELIRHAQPGSLLIGGPSLGLCLVGYFLARLVGSITIESALVYLALVSTLYLFVGERAMRVSWFPIVYLLFVLPPPGSIVAEATQPLRLGISQQAVDLLNYFGYPIGRSGLMIYVSQYILEVKAACGGLNSMISLSAIGLFYAYVTNGSKPQYMIVLWLISIGMAVLGNFIRVIALILITYYFGDSAAQGFLHEFAGLTMFTVALGGVLLCDGAAGKIRKMMGKNGSHGRP
jgi:exosortase